MPDWNVLFGDTRAAVVAFWIVAALLLVGAVIKLWPFVRNAVAIVDALVLLPALVKQVAAMKSQVDGIHHETHKNDGSSIKDAVGRVEKTADRLEEGVAGLHGRMDDVDRQLTSLAREDEALWAEIENTQAPEGENTQAPEEET